MSLDWPDGSRPVVLGSFTLGGNGHATIASTGIHQAIAAAQIVRQVAVKADRENLNTIYIGTSTVTADNATTTGGFHLYPGDAMVFPETNLTNIFVNGTAGDGVSFMWWA